MNKFSALTTVAAIVCGITGSGSVQASSATQSRNQVTAEMKAARASGIMDAVHGEDSGSAWFARQPRQAAGPAPVPAVADRQNMAQAMIGEDSGSFYLSATASPSTLTRSEVIAAVKAARELGELTAMIGEDSGASFLARQRAWAQALYAGPNVGTPRREDPVANVG